MQSHCHHFTFCIHLWYVLWCAISYCLYKNLLRKWFKLHFFTHTQNSLYTVLGREFGLPFHPVVGKLHYVLAYPRSLWVLWQEEREIYEIQSWYRLDAIQNMSALRFGCQLLCNSKNTADSNNFLNLFRTNNRQRGAKSCQTASKS